MEEINSVSDGVETILTRLLWRDWVSFRIF